MILVGLLVPILGFPPKQRPDIGGCPCIGRGQPVRPRGLLLPSICHFNKANVQRGRWLAQTMVFANTKKVCHSGNPRRKMQRALKRPCTCTLQSARRRSMMMVMMMTMMMMVVMVVVTMISSHDQCFRQLPSTLRIIQILNLFSCCDSIAVGWLLNLVFVFVDQQTKDIAGQSANGLVSNRPMPMTTGCTENHQEF